METIMTNQKRDQEGQFTSNKPAANKQQGNQDKSSGTRGGSSEQHRKAGQQSHKNDNK
jgi:uncharacterized protein